MHELSAPLAAAGISILYQSSYMSDFILVGQYCIMTCINIAHRFQVKESRLREVMSLLGAAGFDLYPSDADLLMSRVVSPLLSPVLSDVFQVSDIGPEFSPESGAVLTRTRSTVDTPVTALASTLHLLKNSADEKNGADRTPRHHPLSREKSYSPSSTDVTILPSKLACVGLADESVDSWSLKIVKLVAFPDLIPARGSHILRGSGYSDGTTKMTTSKKLDEITIPSLLSWPRRGSDSTDSVSSSSEDDEGYLSHSPRRDPPSTLPKAGSRSYPDISHAIPSFTPSFKPAAKHFISQVPALSPVELKVRHSQSVIQSPEDKQMNIVYPRVPFFSFTRTSEGSSLTTDVSLLAALFPSGERDMLICAGELDALDVHPVNSDSDSDQDQDSDPLLDGGTLKCLQIDLRRFGLGAYISFEFVWHA